jgi:hypothetical protein
MSQFLEPFAEKRARNQTRTFPSSLILPYRVIILEDRAFEMVCKLLALTRIVLDHYFQLAPISNDVSYSFADYCIGFVLRPSAHQYIDTSSVMIRA